jgi:FMN-dependent NADH-azoreductase
MKLLYIKCDPKPENKSACLRVGRAFVQAYAKRFPDHMIEELDLYAGDIPEVDGALFTGRGALVSGSAYDGLDYEEQTKADRINALCTQFLSADRYAVAAPMWSLLFPPRLKAYVDCVVLEGRAISVNPRRVEGLLYDKSRRMVFIQSCGGVYGNPFTARFNYAANYLKNLFFFLGMEDFMRLPVDGTGMPDIGAECAVSRAVGRIDGVLDDFS